MPAAPGRRHHRPAPHPVHADDSISFFDFSHSAEMVQQGRAAPRPTWPRPLHGAMMPAAAPGPDRSAPRPTPRPT